MSLIHMQPWEARLLNSAQEAFNSPSSHVGVRVDAVDLARAYDACEAMTRRHSKTFFVASSLLPFDKRRAVRALYAFCRVTDDIVDEASDRDGRLEKLQAWQKSIAQENPDVADAVVLAWADARVRYHIPHGYAQQLIAGCGRDITQSRYETFDQLAEYSYGVASTVGLMAMHIIGFTGQDAIPYAVRLGIALQMTNILRDVGEDWANGRLYLPLEELRTAGIDEDDIASGEITPRWREFMMFQIARNRALYAESIAGVMLLQANGRFAITAAAKLYEAILTDIECHDYDVFHRRARINTVGKLKRLPKIWWLSRNA